MQSQVYSENHYLHTNLGPFAILAKQEVPVLRELVMLRKTGWLDEHLDGHFQQQRETADNPDDRLALIWFKKMKAIMREVDFALRLVPAFQPIEFLDIGSAPGGFSSYILRKNKRARGIGITLPVSLGGYATHLEQHFLSRYQQRDEDILEYNLSPSNGSRKLADRLLSRFPLVVLDGHAIRSYHYHVPTTTPEELKAAHGAYRDSLLIAQFIIALEAVRAGGTIVTKLSHIECFPAAHLLYLLDDLSDSVALHKPDIMHASRGTCYAVAKGVCSTGIEREQKREQYLVGLKTLLCELKSGGPLDHGRMMIPGDLDFVVTTEVILDDYLPRLITLGCTVWATQVQGLKKLFAHKSIA